MAGQKFQYDESGGTFFYFLLSFLALILIPATLYYWPRKKKEGTCYQISDSGNVVTIQIKEKKNKYISHRLLFLSSVTLAYVACNVRTIAIAII